MTVEQFLSRPIKGSRFIRRVLDFQPTKDDYHLKLTQVTTFVKSTAIENYSAIRARSNISSWNTYCYPNRLRVFLLKYYSNILGTGNRVQHFNPGAEVMCIFCLKNSNLPAPIETIQHVFYYCPTIQPIVSRFISKYFRLELSANQYFTGCISELERYNKSAALLLDLVRYTIWQFRLLKKNICYYSFENEINDNLSYITTANNKIENE